MQQLREVKAFVQSHTGKGDLELASVLCPLLSHLPKSQLLHLWWLWASVVPGTWTDCVTVSLVSLVSPAWKASGIP